MKKGTYWHNPRCSKSRYGLQLLEQTEAEFEIVRYLDSVPTKADIKKVLSLL